MSPAGLRPSQTFFYGGTTGNWRIRSMTPIVGDGLLPAENIAVTTVRSGKMDDCIWTLSGIGSNLRYTSSDERKTLNDKSEQLGRPDATMAALIPISKSDQWWSMAQDERLAIYRRAEHYKIGLTALPQIARKLYHSRELEEQFDFLTWFEFAPEHEKLFDHMLEQLRCSEEWQYVEREVDIRLLWNGL
jgi:hypothetical protein